MSLRTKQGAAVGVATVVFVAALLVALSSQGDAVVPPGDNDSSATAAAAQLPQPPASSVRSSPWKATVDSCPYVYTFDGNTYYSTQAQCEAVGQDWCSGQVGAACNDSECSAGSNGNCPTAVVSVFFECYYVTERGWLPTCRCFCWVVKK